MEGVMMKSPTGIAMAVRRADGNIVAEYKDFSTKAKKGTFWGLPIVRGCVAFVESLATGIKTTTQSANMYGADAFAEEEPTKFEKWLSKTFGKDIEVLSPVEYRERIQGIIRESYERYCSVQIDCTTKE